MNSLVMNDAMKCRSCGADLPEGSANPRCGRCIVSEQLLLSRLNTPSSTAPESSPSGTGEAGTEFGDYVLFEQIARGGMGRVHRARQKSLNRIVALKRPLPGVEADENRARRFRIEAEAVAALSHPNIIPVFECGVCEGEQFFSMAYVEGETLAEVVRRRTIDPEDAARYVIKTAHAIHHAHQRGVLHRDLKPANIILDHTDEPRVTDFGIARLLRESEESVAGGTPNFMAPEQIQPGNQQVSVATDVYALGGVLYHLLTGRPPAEGQTPEEVLWSAYYEEPVSPRDRNPAVPLDLEAICLKALEKDPGRRYESAQALAVDLERFLQRRPVLARPVLPAVKAWMWMLRNPIIASLLLLLVVSLAAFCTSQWLAASKVRTARAASEGFIGFMNRDLAHDLRDLGRLDLMEKINAKAEDYYTNHTALGDQGYWERKAQFYENMAAVEKDMGELTRAESRAAQAESIYEEQHRKEPREPRWKRNVSRLRTLRLHIAQTSGLHSTTDTHGLAAVAAAAAAVEMNPADATNRANFANVLLEQASVWIGQRRIEPSATDVAQADAILQELVQFPASDPEWSLWLANCAYYRGLLCQLRRDPGGALEQFTNYLARVQSLIVRHPKNVRWQFEQTVAYSRVADAQRLLGQFTSAQSYFRLFEASAKNLTQMDSRNVTWLALHGESLAWQGYLIRSTEPRNPVAGEYLRSAWVIQSNLVFRNPDWDRWLETAARTCSELAKWHQAQGENGTALALAAQWREQCKSRALNFPEHAGHQQRWGKSIVAHAVLIGRIEGRERQVEFLQEALAELATIPPSRPAALARARVLSGLAEVFNGRVDATNAAIRIQQALEVRLGLFDLTPHASGLLEQIPNSFAFAIDYHLGAGAVEKAVTLAESGFDWMAKYSSPEVERLEIAHQCWQLTQAVNGPGDPLFPRVKALAKRCLAERLNGLTSLSDEEEVQAGLLREWLAQHP